MLRVHSVSALMVRSVSSGIAPAAVLPRRRWGHGGASAAVLPEVGENQLAET